MGVCVCGRLCVNACVCVHLAHRLTADWCHHCKGAKGAKAAHVCPHAGQFCTHCRPCQACLADSAAARRREFEVASLEVDKRLLAAKIEHARSLRPLGPPPPTPGQDPANPALPEPVALGALLRHYRAEARYKRQIRSVYALESEWGRNGIVDALMSGVAT